MAQSYTYQSGGQTFLATPTASTTPAQQSAVANNPAYKPVSSGSSPGVASGTGNPLDNIYPNGAGGFNTIPPGGQTASTPLTWDQISNMGLMPNSKKTPVTDPTQTGQTGQTPPTPGAQTGIPKSGSIPPSGGNVPSPTGGNTTSPEGEQLVNKYQGLKALGTPPKADMNSNPRAYIDAANQATASTQPQDAYQPTPQFMQFGDPIMQSFISNALTEKQDITDKGHLAEALKANFGGQLSNLNVEEMNLQNMMAGTVDDIRTEVNKAGGFATEGQVQGLVTSRNKDLIRQFNSLELQKSDMQNQMNMQVQIADMDRQYAQDRYSNTLQAYQLYKGIYDNATSQVDKLVQNVGYSGLAQAYGNDPHTLALAEQHLSMTPGTLSDPKKLSALETYRQKTLNLSASKFNATYGYAPGTGGSVGGSVDSSVPSIPGGGAHLQENPSVPYEKYGLLTNTDFNPKNATDQTALNYLNVYLNNGTVPNATSVGLRGTGNIVSDKFRVATSRANDLYFAATGQNLPAPSVVKNNLSIINANNKLANTLKVQENTVNANFGISLQNLTANNLNSAYPILNNAINSIKNAEGDPNVAQYLTQNATIQQELGNLLAVKNAQGTTVYDKIAGAGLLPKNSTPEQQVRIVKTLLAEAKNASQAFKQVNADLYSSVDPLERQSDNPNRQNHITSQVPDGWIKMTGPKGTFNVDPKNVEIMKKNGYK